MKTIITILSCLLFFSCSHDLTLQTHNDSKTFKGVKDIQMCDEYISFTTKKGTRQHVSLEVIDILSEPDSVTRVQRMSAYVLEQQKHVKPGGIVISYNDLKNK